MLILTSAQDRILTCHCSVMCASYKNHRKPIVIIVINMQIAQILMADIHANAKMDLKMLI